MKSLTFHLSLAAIAVLVWGACSLHGTTAPASGIRWNEKAASAVLSEDQLAGLLPRWKVKQMAWPSAEEVKAAGVTVENALKAECIDWLKKFMLPESLPADLSDHLQGMKEWGLIRKESEQKRLCDVFVVRYTKGNYVVQIQESPFNIVIAVSDEKAASDPRGDHKEFFLEIAGAFLRPLVPTLKSGDVLIRTTTSGSRTLSRIAVREKAAHSLNIGADTDGRFVRFDIIKEASRRRFVFDAYKERF